MNNNHNHTDNKEHCCEHKHHNHCHNHLHHHHSDNDNLGFAFLLNTIFTLIEIVGGLLTNSAAILSDAIHDLGDTISLGITWILEKKSKTKENDIYTYGYHRLSVVGSLINILVLSIGTIAVLTNTIPRIINPKPINTQGMLILAILGVAMNGMAALKVKNGEKISEKVAMLHLMEDALGWLAVLIVSIILLFIDLPILDPLLSLCISIYMLKNIISNTKIILDIILQKVPTHISIKEIEDDIKNISTDILNVENIKCWSLDGESNVITLDIHLNNFENYKTLKYDIEHFLADKYNSKYVSISLKI